MCKSILVSRDEICKRRKERKKQWHLLYLLIKIFFNLGKWPVWSSAQWFVGLKLKWLTNQTCCVASIATTSNIGSPYGHWFVSQRLHFQCICLWMAWEKKLKTTQAITPFSPRVSYRQSFWILLSPRIAMVAAILVSESADRWP